MQCIYCMCNYTVFPQHCNVIVICCIFSFRYKAVYNYKPQNTDELELREGDIVQVMEKCDDGWFVGKSDKVHLNIIKWNNLISAEG